VEKEEEIRRRKRREHTTIRTRQNTSVLKCSRFVDIPKAPRISTEQHWDLRTALYSFFNLGWGILFLFPPSLPSSQSLSPPLSCPSPPLSPPSLGFPEISSGFISIQKCTRKKKISFTYVKGTPTKRTRTLDSLVDKADRKSSKIRGFETDGNRYRWE
jgi:hypothetical protein